MTSVFFLKKKTKVISPSRLIKTGDRAVAQALPTVFFYGLARAKLIVSALTEQIYFTASDFANLVSGFSQGDRNTAYFTRFGNDNMIANKGYENDHSSQDAFFFFWPNGLVSIF